MLVKGGLNVHVINKQTASIKGIQFDIQGLAIRLRNDLALATLAK